MAIVTNWLIAGFCFFAWFRLRKWDNEANYWWRLFFVTFGVSTLMGGMGHAFFLYFGIVGKMPCWVLGCLANAFAARGMLSFSPFSQPEKKAILLIWLKGIVLLALALITRKFIFIAIDAILTYVVYAGIYAWVLSKRGAVEMKIMATGVIILLPSAFIFLLKLNPHRWLNKDDLSHLFMLAGIWFFYRALKAWGLRLSAKQLNHV